ncbi:stage II sporulation protein R [Lentibacillus sediminis]|uniref:stage II sporulation protein R n=1 Tax=Lentibacillus sediminis TaxID=1940529 RepID=UPI000C1BFB38|nr:stage II sporulation protein R [Lentibacillus sediminis]
MKKLVFFAFIFFLIFLTMPANGVSQESNEDSSYQVIPDDAIRLRILANSDSEEDQALKREVRDRVNEVITEWVEHLTDIDKARKLIESRIPEIEEIIGETLAEAGGSQTFSVKYSSNVTFPAKLYGPYLYPPGEYEAVLITIGDGEGANWWCVLFPPLCFLDFSNGTSVAEEQEQPAEEAQAQAQTEVKEDEAEVKFFLFEWFGWS